MQHKGTHMNDIVIKGAREHNLKNIDLTIPRYKLVVLTGQVVFVSFLFPTFSFAKEKVDKKKIRSRTPARPPL